MKWFLRMVVVLLAAQPAFASNWSVPLTVRAAPTGNYLIGYDADITRFANYLVRDPMLTGCGNLDCAPHPMFFAMPQINNQSQAAAAADGSLVSQWEAQFSSRVDPIVQYVYYIRICNEWQGNASCNPFVNGSEDQGEAISPDVWIAGIRNFVNFIRSRPGYSNIKIGFDVPLTAEEAKYWPGDAYVDIVTYDVYAFGQKGQTSIQVWDWERDVQLAAMVPYETEHGKALGFPEWCEAGFDDGYITTQFAQWASVHNVVVVSLWADSTWPNPGVNSCAIDANTGKANAFLTAWGGWTYTGSFWPRIIPWNP